MPVIQSSGTSSELNAQLRDLGSRDLQLWSIGALVLAVVALGFLAVIAPNVLSSTNPVRVDSRYLPQLFTGLVILIVLFNVYLLDQRRRLNQTRESLVRRLLSAEATPTSYLRDPLTDTFTREYAVAAIEREMSRSNNYPYTLGVITLVGFDRINRQFGKLAGDHLLLVASKLIRSSTRGSDIVCRYSGDQYLVILPETIPELAKAPIARLYGSVAAWNRTADLSYALEFRIVVAPGPTHGPAETVVERLLAQAKDPGQKPVAECFFATTSS
jgi:diguanylate cyclase (GGDEF)-like protein